MAKERYTRIEFIRHVRRTLSTLTVTGGLALAVLTYDNSVQAESSPPLDKLTEELIDANRIRAYEYINDYNNLKGNKKAKRILDAYIKESLSRAEEDKERILSNENIPEESKKRMVATLDEQIEKIQKHYDGYGILDMIDSVGIVPVGVGLTCGFLVTSSLIMYVLESIGLIRISTKQEDYDGYGAPY